MSFNIGPVFPSFDPRVSSLDKYRPDFIRPRCNWLFPGREFKLIEAHTAVEPRRCSEKHSWYREISHVLLAEERKEGIPTNYTAIGKRKLHVSNRNEYPSFLTHLLTYLLIYLVTVDPFPRTNRRIGATAHRSPWTRPLHSIFSFRVFWKHLETRKEWISRSNWNSIERNMEKTLFRNIFIFPWREMESSVVGGIELSKGRRARERVCTSRSRYTHVIAGPRYLSYSRAPHPSALSAPCKYVNEWIRCYVRTNNRSGNASGPFVVSCSGTTECVVTHPYHRELHKRTYVAVYTHAHTYSNQLEATNSCCKLVVSLGFFNRRGKRIVRSFRIIEFWKGKVRARDVILLVDRRSKRIYS